MRITEEKVKYETMSPSHVAGSPRVAKGAETSECYCTNNLF